MLEWKKLGTICEIGTGSNNREDACENGLYPFFVRSKEVLRINSFLYDEESILIPGEGGIGEIFHYVNGKYGLHQRTYRVHPISKEVNGRYLYYYLFENFGNYIRQKSYKSTAASIRKPMLLEFFVAIPSLAEQSHIVGILDTFTSVIDNLKQQIEQRRKQYEYYRDQLLDLEGKEGVEMKTLGKVCDFVRGPFGGALKKEIFVKEGFAVYEQQHAIYGQWVFRYYIDETKFSEMKRFEVKSGDILMSCSGTMGKTSIVPADCPKGVINQALLKLTAKDDVSNRYIKLYMDSQWFQDGLKKQTAGGAIQNVASVSVLKDLAIPVPSLAEQSRIVGVLDTFEASIANLEQQLEMRQKQYEYYRNKLFTFE